MAIQWQYIALMVSIVLIQLLQSFCPALAANQTTTPWPELGARRRSTSTTVAPKRDFVSQPSVWKKPPATPTATTSKLLPSTPLISTAGAAKRDYVNHNIPLRPSLGTPTTKTPPQTSSSSQERSSTNRQQEDNELRELSEALLSKDANNAFKYVTINYQGKTYSSSLKDEAAEPLLHIDSEAFKIATIEKLRVLYNNYILQSNENEVNTAQEKIEENNFLDAILPTSVMQHTRNFLISKGKISKDPKEFKDLLRTIWFGMYSRGGGRIGSSGFEHVFLAEIKKNDISGLHNWLYFNEEEQKKLANYLGYMKKLEFEKGAILKYHFNLHQIDKPVGSMFIGTSPEFEIALYSTCFLMRPNEFCPLRLGGKNFGIRTYAYRYRGQSFIGSAFPEI